MGVEGVVEAGLVVPVGVHDVAASALPVPVALGPGRPSQPLHRRPGQTRQQRATTTLPFRS